MELNSELDRLEVCIFFAGASLTYDPRSELERNICLSKDVGVVKIL